MRHIANLCILVLTMFSVSVASAKQTRRQSASLPPQSQKISFKVTQGKKAALYVITPKTGGAQVDFVNSSGSRAVRDIPEFQYNFLKTRIQALNGPSNKPTQCAGKYIEVKTPSKFLVTCMHTKSALSQNMQMTTQMIGSMF